LKEIKEENAEHIKSGVIDLSNIDKFEENETTEQDEHNSIPTNKRESKRNSKYTNKLTHNKQANMLDKIDVNVRYAIKSVSSSNYLDGRNPEHIGGDMLFLTNRQPEGDKYLQWQIVAVDGR